LSASHAGRQGEGLGRPVLRAGVHARAARTASHALTSRGPRRRAYGIADDVARHRPFGRRYIDGIIRRKIVRKVWTALALLGVLLLSGCGYNQFQEQDEAVKAAWSEVLNQYQRRADLIPNLVNTVKG